MNIAPRTVPADLAVELSNPEVGLLWSTRAEEVAAARRWLNRQGFEAFERGESAEVCFCDPGTHSHAEWMKGYTGTVEI